MVKMKGRNTSNMQEGGAHDLKFRSRVTTLSTRFAVENDKVISVNMTLVERSRQDSPLRDIVVVIKKKHARS